MNVFRPLGIAVVVALVMCALFSLSAHGARETAITSASHLKLTPQVSDSPDEPTSTVDLFGNDVSDAVAEYRLDATGSLYEVHSPQTEIPKLASPRS